MHKFKKKMQYNEDKKLSFEFELEILKKYFVLIIPLLKIIANLCILSG